MKSPKTTISDNCCAFLPLTAILIGTRGSPWDPVKHAETLAAATGRVRVALPFAARERGRS